MSHKSQQKKAAKKRARRKAYEKKRNVHRNRESVEVEYKQPVMRHVGITKDGKPIVEKAGEKIVKRRIKADRYRAMQKKQQQEIKSRAIETATGN